jgi:hypothetical protein
MIGEMRGWMILSIDHTVVVTKTAYQDQTKGTAFSSLSAWQKLQYAPKWQVDQRPNARVSTPSLAAAPSSDANNPDETDSTATGICTPSARLASSISCPMGQKAAKKCRINQYKEDEVLSETSNFIAASKDWLASLNEGNKIMKASNVISSKQVKLEEKKLELEEKKQVVEEEH